MRIVINESHLDGTHTEYRQILTELFRTHPVVAMAKISQKKARFALSWAKSKGWIERAPNHGPFDEKLTLAGRAAIFGEVAI